MGCLSRLTAFQAKTQMVVLFVCFPNMYMHYITGNTPCPRFGYLPNFIAHTPLQCGDLTTYMNEPKLTAKCVVILLSSIKLIRQATGHY